MPGEIVLGAREPDRSSAGSPDGPDGADGDSIRIRLDLAYDGTDFVGWAKQADGLRSVEGVLEAALMVAAGRAGGDQPRLVVAGRTDAGVHATHQVAHVELTPAQFASIARRRGEAPDAAAIAPRLSGILAGSGEVVVHASSIAPPGFDARFSALWRRYEYRITDRLGSRDPLQRLRTAAVTHELDDAAMQVAATSLLGLRDFSAYCRARVGATTIRTLQAFDWHRDARGLLVADVRADAFCHGMVRSLVGACIAVGAHRIPPDRPEQLLASPHRPDDYVVAPARGLTLVEVRYPDDDALAERAERTRARRDAAQPAPDTSGLPTPVR